MIRTWAKLLWRAGRTVALGFFVSMSLATVGSQHLQAQPVGIPTPPTDLTDDDLIENSCISSEGLYSPRDYFSDMDWAAEHDARWAAAGLSHRTGWRANMSSVAAKGNTFFYKTGDAFYKFLGAYSEILQMYKIYQDLERTMRFLKEYRLTVNLFRFAPHITLSVEDSVGEEGKVFAVGFFPNSHDGWEKRANLFADNPYYLKRPGAMRLVEIRYPHSLEDVAMKLSVWGGEDMDAEEWQKWMLAGFYDGVTSASAFLDGIGIQNNMALNARNLGPKAMADRRMAALVRRIQALETRKTLLREAMSGHLTPDADNVNLSPAELNRQLSLIDAEIVRLQKEVGEAGALEQAKTASWMKKYAFVNEILSKLEDPDRRLAVATLSTQYKKWERFWCSPDQMNPNPQITGNVRVDNAIFIIWQALTLLSRGQIPPPTSVPGGEAAKAQAFMVRANARGLMADELRASRQLLTFAYQDDTQKQGILTVTDGKAQVNRLIKRLEAGKGEVERMELLWKAKEKLNGCGFS